MKIIYRIIVLFMYAFELPLCLMCGVLIFLHTVVVCPVVYLLKGKVLDIDYILSPFEGYVDYVNNLLSKDGNEQADNSNNEER